LLGVVVEEAPEMGQVVVVQVDLEQELDYQLLLVIHIQSLLELEVLAEMMTSLLTVEVVVAIHLSTIS